MYGSVGLGYDFPLKISSLVFEVTEVVPGFQLSDKTIHERACGAQLGSSDEQLG